MDLCSSAHEKRYPCDHYKFEDMSTDTWEFLFP